MISASSLAFPGSKTLGAWWRELSPLEPQAFWVGHLLVHRIEVLAEFSRSAPLDPMHQLVLEALALENSQLQRQAGAADADLPGRLLRRLGLDSAILQRLFRHLEELGLVRAWALTEAGAAARRQGTFAANVLERCLLPFVEQLGTDGQRLQAPHFLSLPAGEGTAWQPDGDQAFALPWLSEACARPEVWKNIFGFPISLQRVCVAAAQDPLAWQQVVVDHPEKLLVALVQTAERRLVGFAGRQEGWALSTHRPLFALPGDETGPFQALAEAPDDATWLDAWLTWCRGRQLDVQQASACRFQHEGPRLLVTPQEGLRQALSTGKTDLRKGDAWMLAGNGFLRRAVQIVLTDAGSI